MSQAAPAVAHHEHRDDEGSKIGMYLFLFTELLLFGGMFLLYSIYRYKFALDFHHAAADLSVPIGVINTAVLLTSSLTMVLSVAANQRGNRKLAILFLCLTILLGLVFLGNKYIEWSHEIHHGIYPNSPVLLERPQGEILFFGLYYVMTGLHGLHVVAGILAMLAVLFLLARGVVNKDRWILLENTGLYWHLVDIIWIFLLPLFYLTT